MARSSVEFKVGIIILIALVLMAASLYWLQGYKLERNSQVIRVRFNDVGALAVGDKVTVSGVHKGKVNKMQLTDNGVLLELLIYKDVVLKKDARFTIKNLGVMGDRFVAISPGSDSALYDPSQVAIGQTDTGIPEVIGMMGEMITELRALVETFKRSVASDTTMNKFTKTIDNLESLTTTLASFMDHNKGKFDSTAQNFLIASKKINRLMDTNSSKVDSAVERFDKISVGLERFVGQLDTLAMSARDFANALEQEGTLQLLLEDRRLYDDLRETTDNLDDLIADIRANPRKYINLKVEIF